MTAGGTVTGVLEGKSSDFIIKALEGKLNDVSVKKREEFINSVIKYWACETESKPEIGADNAEGIQESFSKSIDIKVFDDIIILKMAKEILNRLPEKSLAQYDSGTDAIIAYLDNK